MIDLITAIYNEVKDYSIYFWAFFIGGVAFEVIFDVIITFFTGGAGAVGKISAKITRLASKADEFAKKGIKLSKDLGRRVAASSAEVLQWVRKELAELIEALKSGELLDYFKEKILKLFDEDLSKVARSGMDDLIKRYPRLLSRGSGKFRDKFDDAYRRIVRESRSIDLDKKWRKDFEKKPRKMNMGSYLEIRKRQFINFTKGDNAERIFKEQFGGNKGNGAKTPICWRYPDNILKGVNREIKSGYIKLNSQFEKQFTKDLHLLDNEMFEICEWHVLGGMEDDAISFMQEMIKEFG